MTQQNKIQFVPQGLHPTTQALRVSVSTEILANCLYDMEAYFTACCLKHVAPDFYSVESWENYVTGAKFLNSLGGRNITYEAVETYLAIQETKREFND